MLFSVFITGIKVQRTSFRTHCYTHLAKKPPTFYGIQRIIALFTRTQNLSISWGRRIQSVLFHPVYCKIHFNIILPSTPGSSKQSLSVHFPNQSPVCILFSPHLYCISSPLHPLLYNYLNNVWQGVQAMKLITVQFLQSPVSLSHVPPDIFLNTLPSDSLSLCSRNVWYQVFHPIKQQCCSGYDTVVHGCTTFRFKVTEATKVCMLALNICGPSVWNLRNVLLWHLKFWGGF